MRKRARGIRRAIFAQDACPGARYARAVIVGDREGDAMRRTTTRGTTTRRTIATAIVLALGGCATRPLTATGDSALVFAGQLRDVDAAGRPRGDVAVPPTIDGRHDVLLLSGGGSDGAFGAGVLVGWSETGKRPSFDIVTGVSTGALMATLAFLGPKHDPDLRRLYTQITDGDILKKRGIFGLFSGFFYSSTPLEKMIASTVGPAMLDEVAAEYRKGRRLYVATTDLDAGTTTVWDMGKIAASASPYRATLYHDVLAASAAIPGVFRPSFFSADGKAPDMHVDGGVKTAVLFRSYMIDTKSDGPQHVWAIVNGQIRWETEGGPTGANITNTLPKTISEMLRTITRRSIYRVYVMAKNGGAAYHLAYIPDTVAETNPIEFKAPEMARLFEAGRQFALRQQWQAEPPRLERLERQPER